MRRNMYALATAFVIGIVVGVALIASSSGRQHYRIATEQLERELAKSERHLDEARRAVDELIDRNSELTTALERASLRNMAITTALDNAERQLTGAITEAGDLTTILEEIIGIVNQIFAYGEGLEDSD